MMDETRPSDRPFALAAIGWLSGAAGVLLVVGSAYRLGAGETSVAAYAALVGGGIDLVAGAALGFGARWAFPVNKLLVPANLLASIAVLAMVRSGALLLWPILFAAATLVLYGPDRMTRGIRSGIRVWRAESRRPRSAAERAGRSEHPRREEKLAA